MHSFHLREQLARHHSQFFDQTQQSFFGKEPSTRSNHHSFTYARLQREIYKTASQAIQIKVQSTAMHASRHAQRYFVFFVCISTRELKTEI